MSNRCHCSMIAVALYLASHASAAPQGNPLPSAEQQVGIDRDIAAHFGDAPASVGEKAKDLSPALELHAIDKATRKVADWELTRSEPNFDRIWTWSVLYTGLLAASQSTSDIKYRQATIEMSKKFNWELARRIPNADTQSIAQTYLDIYLASGDTANIRMIAPTRADLDSVIDLPTLKPNDPRIPWWWCDSLFMAPPVWARMFAATGDHKYIDYLNTQWQRSYDLLYDKHEHLYARDVSFIPKRGPNGAAIYWSRGEGWVMAGIARTLEYLPSDDPRRPFYTNQLREMSQRIASLQGADGLWRSSLLDPAHFPAPETSGSALFVYSMAWGVNERILSRKIYLPVIRKAWRGLLQQVYADGRLGNIQQTGSEPAYYLPTSSFNYGVGAFLLAAGELHKLALHRPSPAHGSTSSSHLFANTFHDRSNALSSAPQARRLPRQHTTVDQTESKVGL